MTIRVTRVEALEGYRLRVEFSDGVGGVIDLAHRLWGPAFAPLEDPELFARVRIDEYGVVCWPGGSDLAPETLYRALKGPVEAPRLPTRDP